MIFSAEAPKTLEDFTVLTGLKKKWAKECFDHFGGYAPAIASFAQSFNSLPEDYFEQKDVVAKNADAINKELEAIYKRAREIKASIGKEDRNVWAAYYTHKFATPPPHSPPQSTSTSLFAASTAPKTSVFGSIGSGLGLPNKHTDPVKTPPSNSGFNFGFGASSALPTSTQISTAFSNFGQPKNEVPQEKPQAKKMIKYCEPSHFTGPFFDMPLFWKEEVEGRCPLLNLNNGFLEENKDTLRKRLEHWVGKASFYKKTIEYVEVVDEDEETIRVIIKDADRTFFHPDHRKKFVAFLNAMFHEFNAYGQAMSYLAGICLLVLDEEETGSILRFVSKVYIPGHWAAEAVGFATSAWVVEHFMQQLFPDVAQHLDELKFWPDTYLQKILTGLCVHVLQFKELFVFLDYFIDGGLPFLIRFCLAIVEHFRTKLIHIKSANDANELYETMRLDSKVADLQDIRAILHHAPSINLGEDGCSIDLIRMKVYDAHVAPRLQRAPKTEAFEPCDVCNERKPKWWQEDLGALCDLCKDAAPELTYTKY